MNLDYALREYAKRHPKERNTVEVFREFLLSTRQPFHRENKEGHVTGSAVVVDKLAQHIILTHHKKLNRWLQLGGHADGTVDVLDVAYREACEESGIAPEELECLLEEPFDIDIHAIPARGDEPAHFHYDVRYLFRTSRDVPLVVSDESHEVAWKHIGTILEDESLGDDMRRLLLKVVEYDKWEEEGERIKN